MLEHIRVLDLTDERGLLCGRLLADLGADVVQLEPLTGSPARSAPPNAHGGAGPSMFWETFAANKRGIALDLDSDNGIASARDLAGYADILVTSLPEAWLRERGLDPDTLRAAHPHLIYTVISAFGWTGPKADYADCDLVVWAAGGPLDPHRDEGKPPVRISVPQAFLHASADAAAGALLALLGRATTGRGQLVDVSAQASLGTATLARVLSYEVGDPQPEWHRQPTAGKDQSGSGAATPNRFKKWRCADGMVELHLSMGPASGEFTNRLFSWLHSENAVSDRIAAWDWTTLPQRIADGAITDADLTEARAAVANFLATRTKRQVLDAAMKHRLLCMAIFDVADITASPHLEERDYWAQVDIDGIPVRIPGTIAHVNNGTQPRVWRRAPRLGEHTADVLADWSTTQEVRA